MSKYTPHITVKSMESLAGFVIPATIPRSLKEEVVSTYINPAKYELVGFIDRTNNVILREKFHNTRDLNGRFA